MTDMPILSLLIWVPILTATSLLLLQKNQKICFNIANLSSLVSLFFGYLLISNFNTASANFQLIEKLAWIKSFNASYYLGVDGITMPLILLTIIIHALLVFMTKQMESKNCVQYIAIFLLLQGITIGVFSSLDSLLFYFFWEAMLIPMYLCIGIWGGDARNYASMKFFLYTFFGSALLLIAIIYLGINAGDFSILALINLPLSLSVQKLLFIGFFMAFAVKVPMWPLHTWLPDAHTEAPAAGSVVLAALMLKVGAYGFFRFCLPVLPDASKFFAPLIIAISLIAIVYIGLVALVQKDMKRLIAYSSVAHMGFVTLGCFAVYSIVEKSSIQYAQLALEGSLMQMVAHGFGSGAMFLAFGLLYKRYHTRLIAEFGGVAKAMPVFAACFMIFALTNVGLPGTAGFVGEFTVILSVFQANTLVAFFAGMTLIIGAAYTLSMFRKVFYGAPSAGVASLTDINVQEKVGLLFLVLCIFLTGLIPEIVLQPTHASVAKLAKQAMVSKLV